MVFISTIAIETLTETPTQEYEQRLHNSLHARIYEYVYIQTVAYNTIEYMLFICIPVKTLSLWAKNSRTHTVVCSTQISAECLLTDNMLPSFTYPDRCLWLLILSKWRNYYESGIFSSSGMSHHLTTKPGLFPCLQTYKGHNWGSQSR